MRKNTVSSIDVATIRDYISEHYGIHYPQGRLPELSRRLDSFCIRIGQSDLDDCISPLLTGTMAETDRNQLIETLTVGETYFFREPEAIEAIIGTIVPALAKQGERRLRIWVAGCATGEEAYTVAMLLHSRQRDLDNWNISILATDINSTFLAKAREGLYTQWSFRTIPTHYKSRYFHKRPDGRYKLDETIRHMVRFEQINLVNGHFPSPLNNTQDCDLILCRNVLMYFSAETIRITTARLARALNNRGWLIVSQTECSDYFTNDFDTVQSGNIFLYRKKGTATPEDQILERPVVSTTTRRSHASKPAAHTNGAPTSANNATQNPQVQRPAPTDLETSSPEDLFRQARTLADEGQLDQACACCEKGLEVFPLSLHGHYLHAAILQELGQINKARAALRKVLYLDSNFVMASYTLGAIEQRLGNQREALNYFDKSARILRAYGNDDLIPETEGLTVGHLKEFIEAHQKG